MMPYHKKFDNKMVGGSEDIVRTTYSLAERMGRNCITWYPISFIRSYESFWTNYSPFVSYRTERRLFLIGHAYLTHSFILKKKKKKAAIYVTSHTVVTTNNILIEYADLTVRKRHFEENPCIHCLEMSARKCI